MTAGSPPRADLALELGGAGLGVVSVVQLSGVHCVIHSLSVAILFFAGRTLKKKRKLLCFIIIIFFYLRLGASTLNC